MRIKPWNGTSTCVSTIVAIVCSVGCCAASTAQHEHKGKLSSVAPTVLSTLPDGLTRMSLSAFQSAFTTLSDSGRVTILAEGVPIHQKLTDKEADGLVGHITHDGGTDLTSTITAVALAYDYEVEQIEPRMFLLRKRYSDQNDLPCVTYKEVVHSLKSIFHVTDQYSSVPVTSFTNNLIFPFYDALSPEQKAHIDQGLMLSDLSEEQRILALSAARQLTLDSRTDFLKIVLDHLVALQDKRTVFLRMRLAQGETFGYQGPFLINGAVWPFPLDNGFTSQISGAYMHTAIIPPKPRLTDFPSPPPTVTGNFGFGYIEGTTHIDPTIPTEQDRFLAAGMLSGRLPSTLTLDEAIKELKSSSPELDASVDDAVGDKPVCLFGTRYSNADSLIRSMTTLYGLEVLVPKEGRYFIILPQPRSVQPPEDAAAELVRLTPPSLLRYYAAQSAHIALLLPVKPIPANLPENMRKIQEGFNKRHGDIPASQACYFPAVRRLCVLAAPHVPTVDTPPIPVASLGSEPLRLLSLFALSGRATLQLAHLNKFHAPQCLANPDTLCIKMDVFDKDTSQTVYARFGYKNSSGEFEDEGSQSMSRNKADIPKH